MSTNSCTENEAKNRTCPRTLGINGGPLACVGSHCMAWRWQSSQDGREQAVASHHETERLLSMYRNNPPHPPGIPETWERRRDKEYGWFVWEEPEADWRARWKGFCGLAGGLA